MGIYRLHGFRSVTRTHYTSSALHWIQVASFPDFFLWKVCMPQFLPSFAVGINFPWWTGVSKSTAFDNYCLGIAETLQREIIQEILSSGFSNQFDIILIRRGQRYVNFHLILKNEFELRQTLLLTSKDPIVIVKTIKKFRDQFPFFHFNLLNNQLFLRITRKQIHRTNTAEWDRENCFNFFWWEKLIQISISRPHPCPLGLFYAQLSLCTNDGQSNTGWCILNRNIEEF